MWLNASKLLKGTERANKGPLGSARAGQAPWELWATFESPRELHGAVPGQPLLFSY